MRHFGAKTYLILFFVLSSIFCAALSPAGLSLSSSDTPPAESNSESAPESVSESSSGVPESTIEPTLTPSASSAPVLKSSITPGFFKKGGNTYYRMKNGKLQTGWLRYKGHRYFFYKNHKLATDTILLHKYKINKKGQLEKTFTKHEVNARKYADEVLQSIVKKGMNKSQKLYAAYSYIVKNTSYVDQNDGKPGSKNWAAKCASHTLRYETGECYGYAAAFVYLAKELGYEDSYVCYGTTRSSRFPWAPHGWAEIRIGKKTYLFDPEIEYKNHTCGKLYKKEYGQVLRQYRKKGRQC